MTKNGSNMFMFKQGVSDYVQIRYVIVPNFDGSPDYISL